ncbi:MAG: RNA polymerase sigma factor [Coprococcus sp.]
MNLNTVEKYIEEYGKDIYSFCVYLTRNRNDADDLYQQTFLVVIEKDDVDDTNNPKSYFISIAANLWNNQKRKYLWRKKKANITYFEDGNQERFVEAEETVEEQVLQHDEICRVRKLVDGLPDKMRMVILMYYMENMSMDEIAVALKIPTGTVKSRLHQAKVRLKERLINDER